MGTSCFRVIVVLVAVACIDRPPVGAADNPAAAPAARRIEVPVHVDVLVEGSSRPTAQLLDAAREHASRIYDTIGVSLAWTEPAQGSESLDPWHIVATVLSEPRADRFLRGHELPSTVLGVAPRQTGRVYLFWDRIARRAEDDDALPEIVLGRVLAHEIGHQLLPMPGHSEGSLMRASMNFRVRTLPTFTDVEARSIRLRLSDVMAPSVTSVSPAPSGP
jgi:hypothetical protein